jgi:hypothetical protein
MPEFHAFGMDIIGQRFHAVREFFRVGDKQPVFVTLPEAPAVVDDGVAVARVVKTGVVHNVGGLTDKFVGNIVREGVPRVPPHWRASATA